MSSGTGVGAEAASRADTSQTRVLTADRVSYAYPSQKSSALTLREVSLTLGSGEWVAVMGPSGSGKSTLLKCLSGLLPIMDGGVLLDGIDVARAAEKRLSALRRDRLGFIFQELNLVPALTAEQNVGLPSRFGGSRLVRNELLEALDQVGMLGKASSRPDQLSGGEQQRVAIARALVSRPAVVFADEPTGALDMATGDQFLDELRLLVDDGSAVLMVTHDPRVAARADRVIWLRDGRFEDEMIGADVEQIAARLARLEGSGA